MALADSIISAESGGDPNARAPTSSATGAGQFIDSTWLDLMSRYRPDLTQGQSKDDVLAMRNDPQLSRQMVDAYAGDNANTLRKAGIDPTPGSLYLAHFAGPGTAVKVLNADPNAPASDVMGTAAVRANPFLGRMTIGRLRDWAAGKVGDTQQPPRPPQPIPQQQAQPAGAPMDILPPAVRAAMSGPAMAQGAALSGQDNSGMDGLTNASQALAAQVANPMPQMQPMQMAQQSAPMRPASIMTPQMRARLMAMARRGFA